MKRSRDELRKQHNLDLIRRMRKGEELFKYDSQASWFPPRPCIAKDPDAVSRLYGSEGSNVSSIAEKSSKRIVSIHSKPKSAS